MVEIVGFGDMKTCLSKLHKLSTDRIGLGGHNIKVIIDITSVICYRKQEEARVCICVHLILADKRPPLILYFIYGKVVFNMTLSLVDSPIND